MQFEYLAIVLRSMASFFPFRDDCSVHLWHNDLIGKRASSLSQGNQGVERLSS
jgi:hypothetical protein